MLGWNPGDDREMFSMEELVEAFDMSHVQKAGAKFNPEKAKWYNKEYLRMKSDTQLAELFIPVLKENGIEADFDYTCYISGGNNNWIYDWQFIKKIP